MLPVVESALLAFETSDELKTLDGTGSLRALCIQSLKAALIEAVKSPQDGNKSNEGTFS